MAKYYGNIGYVEGYEETTPGVMVEKIVERTYFGDVTRHTRRWEGTEYLNDDLTLSNDISILMDPYACHNYHNIRYVEYMGVKWKVTNVEYLYPRLILHTGGVYNGEQT